MSNESAVSIWDRVNAMIDTELRIQLDMIFSQATIYSGTECYILKLKDRTMLQFLPYEEWFILKNTALPNDLSTVEINNFIENYFWGCEEGVPFRARARTLRDVYFHGLEEDQVFRTNIKISKERSAPIVIKSEQWNRICAGHCVVQLSEINPNGWIILDFNKEERYSLNVYGDFDGASFDMPSDSWKNLDGLWALNQ